MTDNKHPESENIETQNDNESQVKHPENTEQEDKSAQFDLTSEDIFDTDKKYSLGEALALLIQPVSEVIDIIDNIKTKEMPGTREHLAEYGRTIQSAILHHPYSGADSSPFKNENSLWRNRVANEGGEIGPYRPRYKMEGALTGNMASLRARQAADMGSELGFPFWRSGLWLKLRAGSDITLLEMERRIAQEKISLGRSTMGAALSNSSIYMQSIVINTLLNHVVDSNYQSIDPVELKKVIRVSDIRPLIASWAATIWPNKYPIVQPCVKDPSSCTHIVSKEISLLKLSKTNNRLISQTQRNILADREANLTEVELKQYQNEHVLSERAFEVNDDATVVLYVPSLYDQEVAGFRWIDNIVTRADEAFGQEIRGEERNRYISEQGKATMLRRYAHWIKEIRYSDGAIVNDAEGIDTTLDVWSADEVISQKIKSEVIRFDRETQLTAVGYARYACPSCKGEADPEESLPNVKEVIPIDPLSVFFTLQRMKVAQIQDRD